MDFAASSQSTSGDDIQPGIGIFGYNYLVDPIIDNEADLCSGIVEKQDIVQLQILLLIRSINLPSLQIHPVILDLNIILHLLFHFVLVNVHIRLLLIHIFEELLSSFQIHLSIYLEVRMIDISSFHYLIKSKGVV